MPYVKALQKCYTFNAIELSSDSWDSVFVSSAVMTDNTDTR